METLSFNTLLEQAVSEEGKLLEAYNSFHDFSLLNRLLLIFQFKTRKMDITPVATFAQWKNKGRYVKKGSKALELCMPIVFKKHNPEDGEEEIVTGFVYKKQWFSLSQTEGDNFTQEPIVNEWDKNKALNTLGIKEIKFNRLDGNVQGYSTMNKEIAINPVAQLPLKTLFHETAHVILNHHCTNPLNKNLQEVEAEAVALLCVESLNLEGSEYCRGYIQHYLKKGQIPESSAKKIISTAEKILKAGKK